MNESVNPILTIGHSTHTIEHFVSLLTKHRIGVIVDVRSQPYSRVNPQFNKHDLKTALSAEGIKYVFLGKELGARSDDPDHYVNGRVQYDRLAKTNQFRHGIDRLVTGQSQHRIALMCAEKEPLDCHRTILISKELVDAGQRVCHIMSDGKLERHEDTMKRLMQQLKIPERDLVSNEREQLERAYEVQAERIAFVDGEFEQNGNKTSS
ncbi:MAG: DUF488 domain-containing protein [Pseudomonadales bacterium]|nr:DUF488 domain-containing protein [Pseudomonadales bacterium]